MTSPDAAAPALDRNALMAAAVGRHRSGDLVGAESLYRRVLTLRSGDLDAQHLLGVVLGRRGRIAEAERQFRAVLRAVPHKASVWSNLGNLLRRSGRTGEALHAYAHALAVEPHGADALANQSGALLAGQMFPAAEVAARRALTVDPTHPVALANLGGALVGQLRFAEAEEPLAAARAAGADDFDLWLNLGHRHLGTGDAAEAANAFRRALELAPGSMEAMRWLGFALARGREIGEARRLLSAFCAERPEPSSAHSMLGHVLMLAGEHAEGMARMRHGLSRPDAPPAEHSTFVFDLNYVPTLRPESIWEEHRRWAERHAPPDERPSLPPGRAHVDPERRLRVGFLSPDLRAHAVAFFFRPVLAGLDLNRFETFVYANVQRQDQVTDGLRALAGHWRDIWGMSDHDAHERMLADELDVMIDLAGHTADSRLVLLGRRVAPVQVSYLGYPNTTGLPTVDWRIVDRWTDPPEQPWHGSERLWRLDRCFLAFDPAATPSITEPPAGERGAITFGSFNNLAKVNGDVIALWARILRDTPGSRLLLKHDVSHDSSIQASFHARFSSRGVDPERIVFLHRTHGYGEHLAAYAQVDIALDPFPYNGTTTTCEALWMGVPVVSLAGTTHAGRVGASLLSAIGLGSALATDADDYVRTAQELARNPGLLRALRGLLRETLRESAIMDHAGLAASFGAALQEMWRERCSAAFDAPGNHLPTAIGASRAIPADRPQPTGSSALAFKENTSISMG